MFDNEQFDKLIKEKAGKKTYSYSAKFWHGFVRKAGWKPALTTMQIVVMGVAGSIIITAGCYFGYRYCHPAIRPVPSMESGISLIDTLPVSADSVLSLPVKTPADTLPEIPVAKPVSETHKYSSTHHTLEETDTNTTLALDTIQKDSAKKQPILRPVGNRRILEINTDTIRSND